MYLHIEMWNVTHKWMKLSKEERRSILDKLEEKLTELNNRGAENFGWARNDELTPYRSDYRYMTAWRLPSEDEVMKLEKILTEVGWYKYFNQANSRGEISKRSDAIDFLVNLEETSTSMHDI